MPAFNYHELIRQVPSRTWQFYFQTKGIYLPDGVSWDSSIGDLTAPIQSSLEALVDDQRISVYSELRRVNAMANRRGIFALRNSALLSDSMLEDFLHHSSDSERSLWALLNWPKKFIAAEAFFLADSEVGKRNWKRIHVPPEQSLHLECEDVAGLKLSLAQAFTPRKSKPRACEVDVLARHLDGGVQFDVRIEDELQRSLEFGPDDKTAWRDVRPPLRLSVIVYPENGVIDMLIPGGKSVRKKVLTPLGKHVFRKEIEPISVDQPLFLLNRLRDGLVIDESCGLDLAAYCVDKMRLSECSVRSIGLPQCDYLIHSVAGRNAPDVLACIKAHKTDTLMSQGFNIIDAIITIHFFPQDDQKKGRILHIGLKPTGITNLRDMDEVDAQLAQAVMRAFGVMQDPPKMDMKVAISEVAPEML
jgi:hypothetical protein